MTDLFYHLGGSKSGNRKCHLEEIQKTLDLPMAKIKEVHEIRWIAFYEATHAIYKTWKARVTLFEERKDKKSVSLLTEIADFRFIACIHLMMDILPAIAQMTLTLQKQDIDVAVVRPALENLKSCLRRAKSKTTLAYYQQQFFSHLNVVRDDKGRTKKVSFKQVQLQLVDKSYSASRSQFNEIKTDFIDTLVKNIEDRFPTTETGITMAFEILSMRPLSLLSPDDQQQYGNEKLEILLQHYAHDATAKSYDNTVVTSPKLIDEVACRMEWSLAKQTVLSQMYPRDSTQKLLKLLFIHHRDALSNLIKLAELALIMSYQMADCERGFSVQNHIKSQKRHRMKEKHLTDLMTIKGPPLREYQFSKAVHVWRKKVHRRIYMAPAFTTSSLSARM